MLLYLKKEIHCYPKYNLYRICSINILNDKRLKKFEKYRYLNIYMKSDAE